MNRFGEIPPVKKDQKREDIVGKVRDYFEKERVGYEDIGEHGEKAGEIVSILEAMESNDYNPAFEYFNREIERLKRTIEEVKETEIGRTHTVPKSEKLIKTLEDLKDSLLLEEE